MNILLFLTDDHGQWALGAYGNPEIHTPNLDHLAETGVLLENAFTPTPVCSAGRACLMSGRLASQHGVHDYLASDETGVVDVDWMGDEVTLAQLLSGAGYQVGLSGKWHLGLDETPASGYDYWFTLGQDYPISHGGTHRFSLQGERFHLEGRKAQIISDYGIRFLRERDPASPFFLSVNHVSPHSSWVDHPERLVSRYRNCSFENVLGDIDYPFGHQNLESTEPTRDNPREALAQYYAAITQLDESVGRLLDELEAQGLLEDTLIVYTSDHGLNCAHHGIWGKGNGTLPLNMVEESIRVPLILNQSGRLLAGQRRTEPVDHLDLFQTLLDYAGVAAPGDRNYPGKSFLNVLEGGGAIPWRSDQFGEYGNLRMIRTDQHKLVRRYPDGPHELFDLVRDPRETTSRFDDPAYQAIRDELTARLETHFATYQDPVKSGLNVRQLPRHNRTEAWR
jgi:arylsulfatase A-like enzyme